MNSAVENSAKRIALSDSASKGLVRLGYDNPADSLQWLDGQKSLVRTPEQGLMLALLSYALDDANIPLGLGEYASDIIRERRRRRDDARRWIAEPASDWTFSFSNCCEALGLDPDWVRKGIQARYR